MKNFTPLPQPSQKIKAEKTASRNILSVPALPTGMGGCDHLVQFYETDEFLVESVAAFIGAGLGAGEGAIVIATATHREALGKQLLKHGIDLSVVMVHGQYVALDAEDMLSRFMINGLPDETLFEETIGDLVKEISARRSKLRAFGEMVALLWEQGNGDAAIRLEELWNQLGRTYSFSLLCGYPLGAFAGTEHSETFHHICAAHSRVLPSESFDAARPNAERLRSIAFLQQKAASSEHEARHRKKAENALNIFQNNDRAKSRETQERLRLYQEIFDSSNDGVAIIGPDGTYLEQNAAHRTMLGYCDEELHGKTPALHLGGEMFDTIARGLQQQGRWRGEVTSHTKAGDPLSLDISAFTVKDDDGRVLCHVGIKRDITDRKRIEDALRHKEAQLQLISDTTPIMFARCSCDGTFQFVNKAYASRFGVSPEDLVGRSVEGFLGQDAYAKIRPYIETVLSGKAVEYEVNVPYRTLGVRAMHVSYHPERNPRGEVIGWISSLQDVTERKRAEEASLRLAAIVESSDDAIVSKDLNGIVSSWNKAAERVFGYTAEEMIGKPIVLLIPADRPNEEPEILRRLRRGERIDHYETVRQRKDGRLIDISLTISPIRNSAGEIIGASKIARDITDRKRIEREQQALYGLVTTVNRAVGLPDIYNAAIEAISRCQNADRASILLYASDRVMRFKAWRGLSEEYRRAVEGHSPWKPDDPDPQPVCINNLADVQIEPHLREVIEREGIRSLAFIPIIYEQRLLGKFMVYYNTPHYFTPEEIRPAQTIAIQIAFAIERERSGQALERLVNERTASLREAIAQMEEFSYSVSHDLRAPVRAMQGYARVLKEDYSDRLDDAGREYVERIIRGGTRMDRMTQDLLIYSRLNRREIELHPISLDKLVRDIIHQYPEMLPFTQDIHIHEPLPDVIGHEPSLMQAVANLLSNALKFVARDTRPKIHIRAETRDNMVRLWMEDNGIGIKPEHQRRLFGMFERIHPEKNYEGTGIGLAIVRRAAERMGGSVGVESDGAHGSKFWIQLRAAENS